MCCGGSSAAAGNFLDTLVAAEVVLNVGLGLMTRAIDYSDSLLANSYTQYVSVRVMEQAARLDLTTYENPVFYDRLERARVQATDRLAMIQQMGRLLLQIDHDGDVFGWRWRGRRPWLVLLLVAGRAAVVSGRDALCVSGVCEELPADAGEAADGLSAAGGGEPRGCERGQAVWPEPVLYGTLPGAGGTDLSRRRGAVAVASWWWAGCWA